MGRYLILRLVGIVPTVLLLVLFVVVLIRLLPGNAVDVMLAEQAQADDVSRQELEARLGLDTPMAVAYGEYALGLFRGDLGKSLWSRQPVTDIIVRRLGVTLELTFLGLLFTTAVGVPVGVVSAIWQNTWLDYLVRGLSVLGLSVPNFAIATMVIVLPALWWGWSPPLIYVPMNAGLWDHLSQFFVPALVLSLSLIATVARMTRSMMLEVLRLDYVRTARAKGLGERTVIYRHALRNALIPVVSILGVQIAFLLSGSVIIENVFALPGIGRTLIQSISIRDYPLVQGITVVTGLLVILVNLLIDLSYVVIDPRVKVG